jgi:dihydroorotase
VGTVLKNVRIIDTASQHHNSIASILIEGGKIIRIGKEITEANHEVFEKSGTCVSAGWIDSRTSLNIPGNEHKEDIKSALNSALAGGFTKVVNYYRNSNCY